MTNQPTTGASGRSLGVDPADVEATHGRSPGIDPTDVEATHGRSPGIDPTDVEAIEAQLGRAPRGMRAVAHRCACGRPDVVETAPRLPDGSPFPTLYYLTCPRAAAECSRLESTGLMRELTARLAEDPEFAERYRAAHADYLARRAALADVPEIAGVSAGGMPDRVKCLHVHLAHTLAAGPGVNPVGDHTLSLVARWWSAGGCVPQ